MKNAPAAVYELGSALRIGRSKRSDLVIDSTRVSRHHATIRALDNGTYCVWDSKSRNGTFVNGTRVLGSRVLRNQDEVSIGGHILVFMHEGAEVDACTSGIASSDMEDTAVRLDERQAVTMVSDIRGYTRMSEKYGRAFQALVAEWFRGLLLMVERRRGIVDKVHGDGVLAYWWMQDRWPFGETVGLALETCDGIMAMRDRFAARVRDELGDEGFDVGVAVHTGGVLLGNLGTGAMQAFTAVGDTVNTTFRLEELTKTLGHSVLISQGVARQAPADFTLVDRGQVEIRGTELRLGIYSLEGYLERQRPFSDDDERASATEEATNSVVDELFGEGDYD
ncbi:MAG: adenylate/guanylate cyclase domain-containing protein [Myxococcales bacterium]|nr:adenylate/guanylate cyclase domain-containing protein [Myxococcales bacterium]